MEQSLLIAILVVVVLLLAGVALLLASAAALLLVHRRRARRDAWDREAAIAKMPARDPAWTPTPIMRRIEPPRTSPSAADEARTEVMDEAQLSRLLDQEGSGTTEVREALEGTLALEDTDETTDLGPPVRKP